MKKIIIAAALLLIAGGSQAQTPQPADWTTLVFTADLNANAQTAWDRIGGTDWCGIRKFLDVQTCKIDSGTGEVGSFRTINGTIVEMVVARTPLSYTYAQPFTAIFYHGTVAVQPVDGGHSKLVYTLIWNQNGLPDEKARNDARESRRTRFQAAVDKMKLAADAKP